jgi:hypothetical protein
VSLRGWHAGRCGRGVSRPLLFGSESFHEDGVRKLRLIGGGEERIMESERDGKWGSQGESES